MVSWLDIGDNSLEGTIPALSLNVLTAPNNRLNGTLPSSLCTDSLQWIDLRGNMLVGEIPPCLLGVTDGLLLGNNFLNGTICNVAAQECDLAGSAGLCGCSNSSLSERCGLAFCQPPIPPNNLTNVDRIYVNSPVSLPGDLRLSHNSILTIEVDGAPAEPLLHIGGCAAFAGTLNVVASPSLAGLGEIKLVAYSGYCDRVARPFYRVTSSLDSRDCTARVNVNVEYDAKYLALVFGPLQSSCTPI
jgi:hypothetical protein